MVPIPMLSNEEYGVGERYPQPILQFKELTVDLVRYNAWKAWIQNIKPRKKVKTYARNQTAR